MMLVSLQCSTSHGWRVPSTGSSAPLGCSWNCISQTAPLVRNLEPDSTTKPPTVASERGDTSAMTGFRTNSSMSNGTSSSRPNTSAWSTPAVIAVKHTMRASLTDAWAHSDSAEPSSSFRVTTVEGAEPKCSPSTTSAVDSGVPDGEPGGTPVVTWTLNTTGAAANKSKGSLCCPATRITKVVRCAVSAGDRKLICMPGVSMLRAPVAPESTTPDATDTTLTAATSLPKSCPVNTTVPPPALGTFWGCTVSR